MTRWIKPFDWIRGTSGSGRSLIWGDKHIDGVTMILKQIWYGIA